MPTIHRWRCEDSGRKWTWAFYVTHLHSSRTLGEIHRLTQEAVPFFNPNIDRLTREWTVEWWRCFLRLPRRLCRRKPQLERSCRQTWTAVIRTLVYSSSISVRRTRTPDRLGQWPRSGECCSSEASRELEHLQRTSATGAQIFVEIGSMCSPPSFGRVMNNSLATSSFKVDILNRSRKVTDTIIRHYDTLFAISECNFMYSERECSTMIVINAFIRGSLRCKNGKQEWRGDEIAIGVKVSYYVVYLFGHWLCGNANEIQIDEWFYWRESERENPLWTQNTHDRPRTDYDVGLNLIKSSTFSPHEICLHRTWENAR